MSIDLSWEEVRHAIVESGFEIKVSERGCKAERELRVLLLLGGDGLHDEDHGPADDVLHDDDDEHDEHVPEHDAGHDAQG